VSLHFASLNLFILLRNHHSVLYRLYSYATFSQEAALRKLFKSANMDTAYCTLIFVCQLNC